MENRNFPSGDHGHTQLLGTAMCGASKSFFFSPTESIPGTVVKYRQHGVAQQMTDGTFDFTPESRCKAQTQLIRKTAHGRISKTKDGAVRLTLTVCSNEGLDIAQTLKKECEESISGLMEFQRKH